MASRAIGAPVGGTVARERNRCIEAALKEIEVELSESLNSAINLADKLRGTAPKEESANAPEPSDVFSRLERILLTVRSVNGELGNCHNAVIG